MSFCDELEFDQPACSGCAKRFTPLRPDHSLCGDCFKLNRAVDAMRFAFFEWDRANRR